MAQNQDGGRYMILSSDTHAGAQTRTYKEFLDPAWHNEFDAWEAAITNPWVDLRYMDAAKVNWDSDARTAACDAEGITGEVLFPNTLTPFYDILVHLSGVPDTATAYARRWAGLQAHNRWLVEFCGYEPKRRKGLIQLLPMGGRLPTRRGLHRLHHRSAGRHHVGRAGGGVPNDAH